MNIISVKAAGFAVGMACGTLYIACAALMLIAPRDAVVRFFNSIMHGLDIEPIVRWDMPWWEACVGVIEITILGWLIGALVAALYNLAAGRAAT